MKHMLRYSFSFLLLLLIFNANAQQTTITKSRSKITNLDQTVSEPTKPTDAKTKKDSIPAKTDRYGLRVGVDLYKLTKGLYDNRYKGIEFVGDYRLTKKYYLAAEIGAEDKTTDDDRLNFTTKGSYLKAGFDYNGYENWLNMENIISVGMRYGFSTFSQQLNTYKIYNPNPYWGEIPPISSGEKFNGLTANWIEVVAGIKAKIFNNVFLGFSLRMNVLIANTKPENFENLYIPGFNRTYNGNFGAGINYTVTYLIPIYKKKVKKLENEKKKEIIRK